MDLPTTLNGVTSQETVMFTFTAKGVTWLITVGGGGGGQNRPWVLGTPIYEGIKRWGRFIRTSP